MAYSGPDFFKENAKALEIKESANAHFRAKEYQKACDIYSEIIDRFSGRVMIETTRVARCNRAACYLNLGEYQRCIDDCNIVMFYMGSPELVEKARYRREKATQSLDEIDAQRREADPLYTGRPEYNVNERIRDQLREADESSAAFQTDTTVEEHRPFGYVVRMKDHDPEYVHMRDMLPISMMLSEPRSSREADRLVAFVKKIVTSHEPELMTKHPWKCYSCGVAATTWIHSPISELASFYPIIKDYARPICEKGGKCEKDARAKMKKAETEDWEIARETGVRIKM
ncbi:hypothetical protein R3P38DRAFT_3037446 [Favolaschia claudopus]|uniref:Uncharacterized protein n=1 Tax=Favolaschia claudopus TaxID=2862362 RepID=A0AAW0AAV2_9AGAR